MRWQAGEEAVTTPRTLAEKLAVAGAVAPVIRQRAGSGRKVVLTDADGKPVRETTDVEVAMGLLRRADIDFSVQPGKRPTMVKCSACPMLFEAPRKGRITKRCHVCAFEGRCPLRSVLARRRPVCASSLSSERGCVPEYVERCRANKRASSARARAARIAAGICVQCGKAPGHEGARRCKSCKDKRRTSRECGR